ncbi:MAG: ABC transporter ATP-binding protein [Caldilineaceae bacterium]
MLTLTNLSKSFGNLLAVDGVSLTVPQGQIIGLIGPNGSGKSTLLSLIAGNQRADSGSIRFGDQEIGQATPDAIFRLGLVRSYQDPSLFFRMSVLDNALLPVKEQTGERARQAARHGSWRQQEEKSALQGAATLEALKLRGQINKAAADLSGGQMKLLEIGRSLMGTPKLLLLDEPTAGVAPALAYQIFEQIARLRAEQGLTFLIIEHRLEILFDFVDSLYVMHTGQVIAQGTPREIEQDEQVREVYLGE